MTGMEKGIFQADEYQLPAISRHWQVFSERQVNLDKTVIQRPKPCFRVDFLFSQDNGWTSSS
jgi:hypothetical protein